MKDEQIKKILDFWFDESKTLSENYHTKWFPSGKNNQREQIDSFIICKFKNILFDAESGLFDHWEEINPTSHLALILLFDQFSRHIYRSDFEKITKNDQKALASCQRFMQKKWHCNLSIPQYIFSLMPLRHSKKHENLQKVLFDIENKIQYEKQFENLLEKFRKTTLQHLIHLKEDKNLCNNLSYDILERHPFNADESDINNHILYHAMQSFLDRMRIKYGNLNHLAISLSGGVDSMVVAKLLLQFRSLSQYVIGIHIDYANREESGLEAQFVEKWCNEQGIIFRQIRIEQVTRGKTKREEYEQISRELRYKFYAKLTKEFGMNGICVGHHRGDVQENIISNLMKGQSLLGLNGMDETSIVNNIHIWRPLLLFDKDIILSFAHRYGIPYFKDTTPKWSTRGKLRNHLMPLLIEMYGEGVGKNLSGLGKESSECKEMVDRQLFQPFYQRIQKSSIGLYIPCEGYQYQSYFFWKEVLRHVCHSLLGASMIREKSIHEFLIKLKRTKARNEWITLKKDNRSYLTEDKVLILFHESFFKYTSLPLSDKIVTFPQKIQYGKWLIKIYKEKSTQEKKQDSISLKKILLEGRLKYSLINSPALIMHGENRPKCLRVLDKKFTDAMPIFAPLGNYDDENKSKEECLWIDLTFE